MQRRKILYIITKSNLGGAQRYVLELATSLPAMEYDVVVAFGDNGLLKTRLEEAGIRTRTIKSFERDISILKEIAAMKELFTLIREERPDIVHLNSSKAGGSGAFVARLCGVRNVVFTAHGWPFYESRGLVWRTLVWFFSYVTTLLVHHVIVVSEHDFRGARMWGQRKKLSLIHTALPPIAFKTRSDARALLFPTKIIETHTNDLWLVSTGEHTRNKNLAVLIDTLVLLRTKGFTNIFLTLMSDGEERAQLESHVRKNGLTTHVYFTGFVTDARVYLKAFDVFLLPSFKEGFPYGLLEAGAASLPVIASTVGGIPELIQDGKTGILIEPENVETITDALSKLIQDQALRTMLGSALRINVETTYAFASLFKETVAIYNDVYEK